MKSSTTVLITIGLVAMPMAASAGCIGPVIMGVCQGQIVQGDTHPQGMQNTPPAPPGFYYDKRQTNAEQQNPGSINPFTGRDAHDANMNTFVNPSDRQRCYERRERSLRQGIVITCP